ncbi:hypothetical protein [Trichoplusia ni ascovirus 2c]|uniref:hypothetical protein n=1 Tax=Trichoplusia ni ascovirus 2c TaxID=328615 RepID=UPI0000E4425E|nr:hypothetical protein TNAV2c_gp134 [Trichoplusia ni ascovirus 2c]ABF70651.1 hypothetical protein [Trichoplusia ni ascovirus 2c]
MSEIISETVSIFIFNYKTYTIPTCIYTSNTMEWYSIEEFGSFLLSENYNIDIIDSSSFANNRISIKGSCYINYYGLMDYLDRISWCYNKNRRCAVSPKSLKYWMENILRPPRNHHNNVFNYAEWMCTSKNYFETVGESFRQNLSFQHVPKLQCLAFKELLNKENLFKKTLPRLFPNTQLLLSLMQRWIEMYSDTLAIPVQCTYSYYDGYIHGSDILIKELDTRTALGCIDYNTNESMGSFLYRGFKIIDNGFQIPVFTPKFEDDFEFIQQWVVADLAQHDKCNLDDALYRYYLYFRI